MKTSSAGNQEKYIKDGWMYKIDTRQGEEALSEVYAYEFSRLITNMKNAEYKRVSEDECKTKLMNNVDNEEIHISLEDFIYPIIRGRIGNIFSLEDTTKAIAKAMNMEYEPVIQWIIQTLMFDRLICNFDRHWNNFGVIVNDATGEFNLSPVFDNGASFFTHDFYNDKFGIEGLEDIEYILENNLEETFFYKISDGEISWEKYKDYRLNIDMKEVWTWLEQDVIDERVKLVLSKTLHKWENILYVDTSNGILDWSSSIF